MRGGFALALASLLIVTVYLLLALAVYRFLPTAIRGKWRAGFRSERGRRAQAGGVLSLILVVVASLGMGDRFDGSLGEYFAWLSVLTLPLGLTLALWVLWVARHYPAEFTALSTYEMEHRNLPRPARVAAVAAVVIGLIPTAVVANRFP